MNRGCLYLLLVTNARNMMSNINMCMALRIVLMQKV